MVKLNKIVTFLNKNLRIDDFPDDYSQNGLQVSPENPNKEIKKIAISVDATREVFLKAKDYDLLIVHHGLLWKKNPNITMLLRSRLKILLDNDLALYVCHLPLDAHETYGNNAELVRLLGAKIIYPWDVGFKAEFKEPVELKKIELLLNEKLNTESKVYANSITKIKRFIVISGGGSSYIRKIDDSSVKLFITGEITHPNNVTAKEQNLAVIASGHYATETLGVKAVGKKLKELYPEIKVDFIDCPTGL